MRKIIRNAKIWWHEFMADCHERRAGDLMFEAHYARNPNYLVDYDVEMKKADKHRAKAIYAQAFTK